MAHSNQPDLMVGAVVDFRGQPGYIAGVIVEIDGDVATIEDPMHLPQQRGMPLAGIMAHRHTYQCECD